MATSIASFTLSNSPATYTATQTATVSYSAGDRIVVGYTAANGIQSPSTPTATGLTFAEAVPDPSSSPVTASVAFFEAIAPAAGTNVVISVGVTSNIDPWCFGVWVVTGQPGQPGAGSATATASTAVDTSRSLTTEAGDIVLMVESDWSAAAAGQTLTAGAGTSNKRNNAQVSGQYAYLYGEWTGCTAATASYGSTNYSGRTCATAALVIKAAPSAITATSKVAKATGIGASQTYSAGATSYTAGRRLVVFGHAIRDSTTNGLGTGADGWAISDNAATNSLTWTLLGVTDIDLAAGALFGTQSVAFISSPLTATETFDITLDANANSNSTFYWAMNVIEVNGATGSLAQALVGDAAAGGSTTVTFGGAPSGFQLACAFALSSHDDIVFNTPPDEWAELGAAATVNGGQSCKAMWSAANTATGVTWGWNSAAGSEIVTTLIAIELTDDTSAATLVQEGFRWGLDDGSESAHTWAAAQDTNLTVAPGGVSRLLRVLVDAASDPTDAPWSLRYQKNGTGGYADVPVGSSEAITPSPTSGDVTYSFTNNTTSNLFNASTPALAAGDLIIIHLGWDDSTTVTDSTPANGPNGETWTRIGSGVVASASTEVRGTAWWTVATGAWSAGTLTVTSAAAETVLAEVLVIPAGEFDPVTPIGAAATRASVGTAETAVQSPSFTAGASDGGGRLVHFSVADADPQTVNGAGWTGLDAQDPGAQTSALATRNTAVTDSESITGVTVATIASDSWCSIGYIIRGVDVTNEVYVATSANIAAGGEATTARLTPPSGKTTGDFTTGRRWDDENGTDSIDIAADGYTEFEWSLGIDATAADYFDFRVYKNGSPLDTYTATPRVTVTADVTVDAGEAAATAAAHQAAVLAAPAAGEASASATAHNATVDTGATNKWADQTHDFPGTSIDGTFWPGSYGATPTVHDNVLDYTGANNTYSGRATQGFDLIGSSISFQVPTLPSPGGFGGGSIKADAANTDIFELQVRPGVPAIRTKYYGENWGGAADSTNVAVTPQAGTYLRISESGGTVTTEYSLDGSSWTTLDTYTPSASALAAMGDCKLELNHGPFPDAQTAGPTFAKINLLPESTSVNAGEAQGTATAQQAAVLVSPNAGQASATAAAQTASAAIAPNAGQATATATAQQPSTSVGSGIGSAAATATAHQASTWLYANASEASGTVTAHPASILVAPNAGEAQATATSHVASTRVAPAASTAQATAAAHDATASTSVGSTAGQAATTAVAWLASVALAIGAASGAATATAHDATVLVGQYAPAAEATSTATAQQPSVSIAPTATAAAGTVTAHQATAGISPSSATATATTTAHQAAVTVAPAAGHAQSTATAHDAAVATAVAPTAGEAPATATAHNASVSAAANAGQASATASGHNAVADVGVPKWEDITNDFADGTEAADNFNTGGQPSVYVGNKASWDIGAADGALFDQTDRDLTGSYVALRVEPNPSYGYTELQITRNAGATLVSSVYKRADQSVLTIYYNGSTVATPTWDATAMAWWRWREAAGTLYLETSPNGITWTERWSDATAGATFDLTTAEVQINAGHAVGGDPGVTGVEYAYVSKFNLLPVGSDAFPGNAEVIATAYPATVSTTANPQAGEAAATATAHQASISTTTSGTAQTATATAAAHDATVSTSAGSIAGEASATATAHDPSVHVAAGAQTAAATATAEFETGTSVSLDLVADLPIQLAATAHDATISTAQIRNADAGHAQATATAHDATVETANPAVDANAGQAAATATAHDATAAAGQVRTADAGQASAAAAAHDAVAQVGARPSRVNGSTAFYVPSIAKTVIAPIVNATASIPAPTLRATGVVTPARVNGLATVFVPGVSMRANAPYFEATTTFFMPTPAEAQFVVVQVWNGTAWESGVLNVWNGSEWKPGSLRVYLAGQWQP